MAGSFCRAIEAIQPYLPPSLVLPEALTPIKRLAGLLPPFYWGGFECRLNDRSDQIDFHQGITRKNHISALIESPFFSSDITKQADFKSWFFRWSTPFSLLNRLISACCLEFDTKGKESDSLPLPSFFMFIDHHDLFQKASFEQLEALIGDSFFLLTGRNMPATHRSSFFSCVRACPETAYLSHIGMMLSRSSTAVRLNFTGIHQDDVTPFLNKIGLSSLSQDIDELMRRLYRSVDYLILCLDINGDIGRNIGLECYFYHQPDKEPRWGYFLNQLVSDGLCTKAKKEALLRWPGYGTPLSQTDCWPPDLIMESITGPKNRFTLFRRQLNHIKITYHPGIMPEAKGYLSFFHDWINAGTGPSPL